MTSHHKPRIRCSHFKPYLGAVNHYIRLGSDSLPIRWEQVRNLATDGDSAIRWPNLVDQVRKSITL